MKRLIAGILIVLLVLAGCTRTPVEAPQHGAGEASSSPQISEATPPTSPPQDTRPIPTEPEAKTIIVTSTSESGPGTLRHALLDARSGDTITFDSSAFPPGAPATIYLSVVNQRNETHFKSETLS